MSYNCQSDTKKKLQSCKNSKASGDPGRHCMRQRMPPHLQKHGRKRDISTNHFNKIFQYRFEKMKTELKANPNHHCHNNRVILSQSLTDHSNSHRSNSEVSGSVAYQETKCVEADMKSNIYSRVVFFQSSVRRPYWQNHIYIHQPPGSEPPGGTYSFGSETC